MKTYSSFSMNGSLIMGNCLSVEDCLIETIKRANELGFVKTFSNKERKLKFRILESNVSYSETNGVDYTDGQLVMETEIILK